MTSLLRIGPDLVWEARKADHAMGSRAEAGCSLVDLDGGTEAFCVFDPLRACFVEVTPGGGDVLGPVGDFGDGSLHSYWNQNDQPLKGLSLASLPDGLVETFALPAGYILDADNWWMSVTNGMRVHPGTAGGLVEGPEDRSTVYGRVFQVLIRRVDGADLASDAVFCYARDGALGSGARVDNGLRGCQKVPNRDDGWHWLWTVVPPSATTATWFGLELPAGAPAYEIEAPMLYNIYTGFANIPRCPILNGVTGSNERGQYQVLLEADALGAYPLPTSGFLGLALTLPFSVDHVDHDGVPGVPSCTLAEWVGGDRALRLAISSVNYLAGWIQDAVPNYPVYHVAGPSWQPFQPLGLVMRWEERDGACQSELYLNGRTVARDWESAPPIPSATTGRLSIGCKEDGANAADAWIERAVAGRHRISEDQARELSLLLEQLCMVRG